MTCTRCGKPTDGVELSPGCRSAVCPTCHDSGRKPPVHPTKSPPATNGRKGPKKGKKP